MIRLKTLTILGAAAPMLLAASTAFACATDEDCADGEICVITPCAPPDCDPDDPDCVPPECEPICAPAPSGGDECATDDDCLEGFVCAVVGAWALPHLVAMRVSALLDGVNANTLDAVAEIGELGCLAAVAGIGHLIGRGVV